MPCSVPAAHEATLSNLGSSLLEINSVSHNEKRLFGLIFFRFLCGKIMTVMRKSSGHQPSSQGPTMTFYRGLFQRWPSICGVVSRKVFGSITSPSGLKVKIQTYEICTISNRDATMERHKMDVKGLNVPMNEWIVRNFSKIYKPFLNQVMFIKKHVSFRFLQKIFYLRRGGRSLCIVQTHAEGRVKKKEGSESMRSHVKYTRIRPSRCRSQSGWRMIFHQ